MTGLLSIITEACFPMKLIGDARELRATTRSIMMRQPVLSVGRVWMLLALAVPHTGCSGAPNVKTVAWREEVKLSNQVVVVKRAITYREAWEPGRGSGWLADTERVEATFDVPFKQETVWEARLQPLCMDVSDQGVIYLIAAVGNAQGRREYAVPEGSYHVAFRSSSVGNWERVPIVAVRVPSRPNLLVPTDTLFLRRGHPTDRTIDLEFKTRANADPRIYPPFRRCPVD